MSEDFIARLNINDCQDLQGSSTWDGLNPNSKRFIDEMGRSLQDTGFFIIHGHPIETEELQSAYDCMQQFFALDEQTKVRYEAADGKGQRGYTRFGKEHAKDSQFPDLKEFWHVGCQADDTILRQLDYPQNVWPSEVPAFKEAFATIFLKMEAISQKVLRACSLFLELEADRLSEIAVNGNSILRLIHYPPLEGMQKAEGSVRAAAHEDINLITLLPEATTSGLELLTHSGRWMPVVAEKGDIIIDTGDMMQNITGGVFKSTTHRVVNPSGSAGAANQSRYSMPFFVHPRSEVDLTPLNSLKNADRQKFPSITAGQYLHQRLAEIGLS